MTNPHQYEQHEIDAVYRAIRERRDMRHFRPDPIDPAQLASRVEQSRAQVSAADASVRLAKATGLIARVSPGRVSRRRRSQWPPRRPQCCSRRLRPSLISNSTRPGTILST